MSRTGALGFRFVTTQPAYSLFWRHTRPTTFLPSFVCRTLGGGAHAQPAPHGDHVLVSQSLGQCDAIFILHVVFPCLPAAHITLFDRACARRTGLSNNDLFQVAALRPLRRLLSESDVAKIIADIISPTFVAATAKLPMPEVVNPIDLAARKRLLWDADKLTKEHLLKTLLNVTGGATDAVKNAVRYSSYNNETQRRLLRDLVMLFALGACVLSTGRLCVDRIVLACVRVRD